MLKQKILLVLYAGFLFPLTAYSHILVLPSQEKISACKEKVETLIRQKERQRFMLLAATGLLSCASIYWLFKSDDAHATQLSQEAIQNEKILELLKRVESTLSESWTTWLGKQSAQVALGAIVSMMASAVYSQVPLVDIAYEQLLQPRDFNWFVKKQTNVAVLLEHFSQQIQDANNSAYSHEQVREQCITFWNIFSEQLANVFAFIDILLEQELEKDSIHAYLSMLKKTMRDSCQTFVAAFDDWDFHKASKEDLKNTITYFKLDFLAQIERFAQAQYFIN